MNAALLRRFHPTQLLVVPLLFGMLAFGPSAFAATDEAIELAIDDGITWLVNTQNGDGSWSYYGAAGTCFALIKLQDRAYELGYDSPFDAEYPYVDNVIAGWNYVLAPGRANMQLFSAAPTETAANGFDGNDNGLGLFFQYDSTHWNYTTGICLMALASTGTPDRVNELGRDFDGNPLTDPETYGELAQDTVDYLAWAQEDTGSGRGGWYYNWQYVGADNSHSGYVTLGLAAAENFGVSIPQWVKDELNFWIDYIQNDTSGGSGYTSPDYWVNILKTGNLLFEMTFVGDPCTSERFQKALGYIEANWRDTSAGIYSVGWGYSLANSYYQAMFALMKGFEYSGIDLIDTDGIGGRDNDWFNQEPTLSPSDDFASVLVAQQNTDTNGGYWPGDPWADVTMSTLWALLTLERIAPESDPFSVTVTKDYRYTAVCFERDNDLDGLFNEDPVDFATIIPIEGDPYQVPIDNDGDGLYNEDPVDCDPSDTGYALPLTGEDPEAYTLEAVLKKNGTVTSYNPGQYYAVSKLEICRHNPTIDSVMLTFVEDYSQCTLPDYPLSERSPQTGGGSVVVVEVVDGVAYQIFDANCDMVTFDEDADGGEVALVEFEYTFAPEQENAELLVYVKFAPGLKGMEFDDEAVNMCENINTGILDVYDDPELDPVFTAEEAASAWLTVVPK